MSKKILHEIIKGSGLLFIGSMAGMFFGFISRTIIARCFTVSDYGIFSLSITIISMAMVISVLGFPVSIPREISFFKNKDPSKVGDIISISIIATLVSSLLIFIILFLKSGNIALIFHEKNLEYPLKILSISLPFLSLISTITSILRGFGRVKEQVFSQNILYPSLFLIFILLIIIFDFPFVTIFYSYDLSQILVFFILVIWIYLKKFFKFKLTINTKIGRELLIFSLSLLLVNVLNFIMDWTDTLMLGYYKSAEIVGLYNAAVPLAKLIPIFLGSVGLIYVPLVSGLYAEGKIEEMKGIFQTLTKWIFLLTLPIFAMMLLFPEVSINLFFGSKYISASNVLMILSLSFMFHVFLGLNGLSLVVIKENRFIMLSTFISAVLNIILNALLIPIYGIIGASIATAVSYLSANILNSIKLYKKTKIHPFNKNYIKSLIICFILLFVVKVLLLNISVGIIFSFSILVIFLIFYYSALLLTKCFDSEDIDLLSSICKKIGINIKILEKLIK